MEYRAMSVKRINQLIFMLLIAGGLIFNTCIKKTKVEDKKTMANLTIEQVQSRYQDELLEIAGVVGVGIGAVKGEKVIKVLVAKRTPKLERKIPTKLEGFLVIIEETGEIRAF